MKIRHKILLTTLSTLILSGPVVLGLVSALVIKNPDTPTPPKPIAQEYKKIGNYQAEVTESDEFPAVYILKSKESTDENVLRFMEIKTGSVLQNTYGCAGWTVFGTKIETVNTSDNAYNLAIDENTIPQTILVDNVEKSIVNICGFGWSTISSITVPNFIETVGANAFTFCYDLINLDLTKATNLTTIGNSAFSFCKNVTNNLIIPDKVITIGSSAFKNCSKLTNTLIIPNSVTTIYDSAFEGCSGLTGVLTIPDAVVTIGANAFGDCSGLAGTLIIPSSVTSIGDFAFENCSKLTGLDLSNAISLKTIGEFAFSDCSKLIGTLTISANVTSIGDYAFSGPHFTSINVDSVNPKYALASSKSVGTANVVIDKTLTPDLNYDYSYDAIGGLACGELTIDNDPKITKLKDLFIANSGITSVIIQENITQINSCFSSCGNLLTLNLENAHSLQQIWGQPNSTNPVSFAFCSGLTGNLTIPQSLNYIYYDPNFAVTSFNESAFSSLIFKAATPSNDINYESAFKATIAQSQDKYTITVPTGSKALYQAKFSSVPASNIVEA